MKENNNKNVRGDKMELNRLSKGIIVSLLTAASMFGGFMRMDGATKNEQKNIKEQQIVMKKDFEKDLLILKEDVTTYIRRVEEDKADKDIVNLLMDKVDAQGIDIKEIKNILINNKEK